MKAYRLNPERIAYLESAGWRAYYDRDWPKLLHLLVTLCQEQFRIPFPTSLLAAYYVTRAAAAWAPVDHDEEKVKTYYAKFYRLARRDSALNFDPVSGRRIGTAIQRGPPPVIRPSPTRPSSSRR